MYNDKTLQYRSLMSATIDADRYFPIVSIREPDAAIQHLLSWLDQWSYISNISAGNKNIGEGKFLESNEIVISLVDNGLSYAPKIDAYVIGSNYTHTSEAIRDARFTDIIWPDPIDQKSIISAAKNFLVYPALAALGGLLTGGPTAAAVAGGTAVAKAAIESITSPTPVHTTAEHKTATVTTPTPAAVAVQKQNEDEKKPVKVTAPAEVAELNKKELATASPT
jgi:hypothetical protein